MSPRDVCAKCGETLEDRVKWWLTPSQPGVVKAWEALGNRDLTGLFLYCEHCQKAICGGCSIDLGVVAGCPFCKKEAKELTHQEIQELLGQERMQ